MPTDPGNKESLEEQQLREIRRNDDVISKLLGDLSRSYGNDWSREGIPEIEEKLHLLREHFQALVHTGNCSSKLNHTLDKMILLREKEAVKMKQEEEMKEGAKVTKRILEVKIRILRGQGDEWELSKQLKDLEARKQRSSHEIHQLQMKVGQLEKLIQLKDELLASFMEDVKKATPSGTVSVGTEANLQASVDIELRRAQVELRNLKIQSQTGGYSEENSPRKKKMVEKRVSDMAKKHGEEVKKHLPEVKPPRRNVQSEEELIEQMRKDNMAVRAKYQAQIGRLRKKLMSVEIAREGVGGTKVVVAPPPQVPDVKNNIYGMKGIKEKRIEKSTYPKYMKVKRVEKRAPMVEYNMVTENEELENTLDLLTKKAAEAEVERNFRQTLEVETNILKERVLQLESADRSSHHHPINVKDASTMIKGEEEKKIVVDKNISCVVEGRDISCQTFQVSLGAKSAGNIFSAGSTQFPASDPQQLPPLLPSETVHILQPSDVFRVSQHEDIPTADHILETQRFDPVLTDRALSSEVMRQTRTTPLSVATSVDSVKPQVLLHTCSPQSSSLAQEVPLATASAARTFKAKKDEHFVPPIPVPETLPPQNFFTQAKILKPSSITFGEVHFPCRIHDSERFVGKEWFTDNIDTSVVSVTSPVIDEKAEETSITKTCNLPLAPVEMAILSHSTSASSLTQFQSLVCLHTQTTLETAVGQTCNEPLKLEESSDAISDKQIILEEYSEAISTKQIILEESSQAISDKQIILEESAGANICNLPLAPVEALTEGEMPILSHSVSTLSPTRFQSLVCLHTQTTPEPAGSQTFDKKTISKESVEAIFDEQIIRKEPAGATFNKKTIPEEAAGIISGKQTIVKAADVTIFDKETTVETADVAISDNQTILEQSISQTAYSYNLSGEPEMFITGVNENLPLTTVSQSPIQDSAILTSHHTLLHMDTEKLTISEEEIPLESTASSYHSVDDFVHLPLPTLQVTTPATTVEPATTINELSEIILTSDSSAAESGHGPVVSDISAEGTLDSMSLFSRESTPQIAEPIPLCAATLTLMTSATVGSGSEGIGVKSKQINERTGAKYYLHHPLPIWPPIHTILPRKFDNK